MKPVVLTVEWEDVGCVSGYPKVTGMRPMTWWEHLKHITKKKISKSDDVPENVFIKKNEFDIAIELSKEQYTKLMLGDASSTQAMQYLKGQSAATIRLMPPPEANTIVEPDGDDEI